MANWKLSEGIKSHLRGRVEKLSRRALDQVLNQIPLDTDDVQRMVLEDVWLERCKQMKDNGFNTIGEFNDVRIAFLRQHDPADPDKRMIPGLKRSLVVRMNLQKSIFVRRSTAYSIHSTKFSVDEGHYIIPDIAMLEEEKRKELLQWLEDALLQQRLYEVATCVTKDVLDICKSVAHLRAFWPALLGVIDVNDSTGFGWHGEGQKMWADRFRTGTKITSPYRPSVATVQKYHKLLKAAELPINTGLLIGKDVQRRSTERVVAFIEHWERLPNDVKFPLSKD